jgi:hypothetical protein
VQKLNCSWPGQEGDVGSVVVADAVLQCAAGSVPSAFGPSGVTVSASKPAGVTTDVLSQANILPFGTCQLLNGAPCVPSVLTPWTPGSARVTVNGVPALDDDSSCTCGYGGIITVKDAGQTSAAVL